MARYFPESYKRWLTTALHFKFKHKNNKMARKDQITLPSSGAGITRYFDDYKSRIEFKPEYVIVMVIVVIIIEIFLHTRGSLC